MGKTKKAILFIVEGITDKTALGSVLDLEDKIPDWFKARDEKLEKGPF